MQTIESIECFKTSDGTIFSSKEEAIAHENRAAFSARIDGFIQSREWPRGQNTQARRLITDFLAYEASESGA